MTQPATPKGSLWARLLLLVPFVALLLAPLYNDREPTLWGFPLFYWYQFLWVPLTSLILLIIYRAERSKP